jgi:ADP-glucose pyrophosphorylase
MGIYIFRKDALKKLFDENPDATDFGKGIIPAAIQSGYQVSSYLFDDYWTDIGNIRSFFEANLELCDAIPRFNLFDNHKRIYSRARALAPSKFFGTKLNKSIVAEGCIIHARLIDRSVIGVRSRIGENTKVKNSIIMGNDYYQTLEEIVLKKDEIRRIMKATKESGLTLIPLSMYFNDGYAKVEIALARGRKSYDKRHAIAERESKREASKAIGRASKGLRD